MIRLRLVVLAVSSLALWPNPAAAATDRLIVIIGGQHVGHLTAVTDGASTRVEFDYKDNGRGPTITESITTDASGRATSWTITGTTTFGSKVDERFAVSGKNARWTDPTGQGTATIDRPKIYVAQGASPWALGLYARALLKGGDQQMDALPSGHLSLERGKVLGVTGPSGPIEVTSYALMGIDLNPSYFVLDAQGALFAYMTPDVVMVPEGYEPEETRLRATAVKMATERYVAIQKKVAHRYDRPVRIRNIRVFDPKAGALSGLVSVVMTWTWTWTACSGRSRRRWSGRWPSTPRWASTRC